MAEQLYDLFFNGELLDGHYIDFVKADLQQLFKSSDEEINQLFSGQSNVIKAKANRATAVKYQQAFKQAGAKLIVRLHAAKPTQLEPTPSAKPDAPVAEATPSTSSESRDELTTLEHAQTNENASELIEQHQPSLNAPSSIPNWDISEPGVVLVEPTPFIPANINVDDLSVAAPGAQLTDPDHLAAAPTLDVDTGYLSIAPVGSEIEGLDDKPDPVVVDISHLQLK